MKTSLYLGTDPSNYVSDTKIIHFPIIEIVPRTFADEVLRVSIQRINEFTHLVLTSKNAVRILFNLLRSVHKDLTFLNAVSFLCIGSVTAKHLELEGFFPSIVAEVQTQEGLIQQIECLNWQDANVFFPRSSLSRNVLSTFLIEKNIKHTICDLYDTITSCSKQYIDLNIVDEIVFTSPSTVEAFIEKFGSIPANKKLVPIGPITKQALQKRTLYQGSIDPLKLS